VTGVCEAAPASDDAEGATADTPESRAGVAACPDQVTVLHHDGAVNGEKAAQGMLRLAVESCPGGMVMSDAAGKIALVNREIERLFGYDREELIGKQVEVLVPERFRSRHASHRAEFAADPKPRPMGTGRDLVGLRKDGTEFPVEVGLTSVRTATGLVTLCVVVDVTERKRKEQLKDEFVSTVSHELRTPLTSISASLGLLVGERAGKLPQTAQRLLVIADTNCQRLIRLVNDILDIEKMEAGRLVFKLIRVDAASAVTQAINANRGFAKRYGVRIRFDAASAGGAVNADPDLLAQVITNLLSNAIKFSPAQGEVQVSVDRHDDEVRISVRDHGPGVPPHFKAHMFEKFAQADGTDSRRRGGTGLGLSIVKHIVEGLGGKVTFDNHPGGGALFSVILPAWDATAGRDTDAGAQPDAVRILLCEDDREAAAAMRKRLRPAGFATDFAFTTSAAIVSADATDYAAILVDLQLPDGDGISLILHLRSKESYRNTPIVVVSSDPHRGLNDMRSSKLEVLGWLNKPVDFEHLVRVLNGSIRSGLDKSTVPTP
jgi:PAS domain S-box-containing protein